ncbi:hypothetical protein IWW38_004675, partial [Coemansia aciculifera]
STVARKRDAAGVVNKSFRTTRKKRGLTRGTTLVEHDTLTTTRMMKKRTKKKMKARMSCVARAS